MVRRWVRLERIPLAIMVLQDDWAEIPINWERVKGFRESIYKGTIFPALNGRWEGELMRIHDGRHRYLGYNEAQAESAIVQVEYDEEVPGSIRYFEPGPHGY
jgi:hypothetical protein